MRKKKFQISQPKTDRPMDEKLKVKNWRSNTGQIVLILVLVTVIGLTIGLSLISRTVTDVRISSQIEQSSRAFSAAEAGVETALKGITVGGANEGTVTLPDASATYKITDVGGTTSAYYFPVTSVGDAQTLWLAEHIDSGTLSEAATYSPNSSLEICWGPDGTSKPAIILGLFYKESGKYKIAKLAYDSESRDNGFEISSTCGIPNSGFRFGKNLSPLGSEFGVGDVTLLALRIQLVYANSSFLVKPDAALPVQGKEIISIGQTATDVVKKMQVTQGYPVLPALLDFSLFSED